MTEVIVLWADFVIMLVRVSAAVLLIPVLQEQVRDVRLGNGFKKFRLSLLGLTLSAFVAMVAGLAFWLPEHWSPQLTVACTSLSLLSFSYFVYKLYFGSRVQPKKTIQEP